MKQNRASLVVVGLASLFVVAILVLQGRSPEAPVQLGNAQAQAVPDIEGALDVYVTIVTGELPDLLIGAESPAAEVAQIFGSAADGGLAIPARSEAVLSRDGVFLRLNGVDGVLDEGRLVPVTLIFGRSGPVSIRAKVAEQPDPHAMHTTMAPVEGDEPPPELRLQLEPAASGATLVRLEVANFTFDPGGDAQDHVPGHGHAHLYLDGLKLQRMYTPEALIGALPPGEYEVRVELNSNLHMPYRNADGPVEAREKLKVE